mgnify:CR=1 FL=1
MKQLNLFSERRSDTIRDFKNEIASYMDILSETSEKISYSEFITPHKGKEIIPGMEYEEYVDIKKKDLKGLTYDQILLFLKNIELQERIDQLKKLLKSRNISFKTDLFT